MGEHAIANSAHGIEDGCGASASNPIPPQVLARWAALASERAYFSMLPHQAEAIA